VSGSAIELAVGNCYNWTEEEDEMLEKSGKETGMTEPVVAGVRTPSFAGNQDSSKTTCLDTYTLRDIGSRQRYPC
jgi:hypothetical protein